MHSLSFSVDHTDLQFDSNDLDGDAAIVILSLTLVYPSEIRSSPPDGVLRSVWSLRIAERSASVYSNQPTGPIGAICRAKDTGETPIAICMCEVSLHERQFERILRAIAAGLPPKELTLAVDELGENREPEWMLGSAATRPITAFELTISSRPASTSEG